MKDDDDIQVIYLYANVKTAILASFINTYEFCDVMCKTFYNLLPFFLLQFTIRIYS